MQPLLSGSLNNAQLHILQIFKKPMSPKELDDLKDLLVDFFDMKAQEEMNKIWNEKKLDQKKLMKLANLTNH